jgi:hypothetical protein
MIKFVGQLAKDVRFPVDGGFLIKFDVTQNFNDEIGELVKLTGKNLAIEISEAKG